MLLNKYDLTRAATSPEINVYFERRAYAWLCARACVCACITGCISTHTQLFSRCLKQLIDVLYYIRHIRLSVRVGVVSCPLAAAAAAVPAPIRNPCYFTKRERAATAKPAAASCARHAIYHCDDSSCTRTIDVCASVGMVPSTRMRVAGVVGEGAKLEAQHRAQSKPVDAETGFVVLAEGQPNGNVH